MKKLMNFVVVMAITCFFTSSFAQDNTENGNMQGTETSVRDSVITLPSPSSTLPPGGTQTQMKTQSSQTKTTTSMTTSSAGIHDLSGLGQKPNDDVMARYNSLADQQSRAIQQKLGLDEDQTKDIKESLVNYFKDEWKSRVALDQEKGNAKKVNDLNEDLANLRVDLAENIADNLNDQQKAQWQSSAVNWWTTLDKSIFDIQQNESTVLSRGNNNKQQQ